MPTLSRRDMLAATGVLLAGQARAQKPDPAFPGLVVRMNEPRNLEFPFQTLNSWLTPTEQFFVRSHFALPEIDEKNYRISIEGAVEKPLSLSLSDLKAMTPVTRPLTLECAGNGRVFLVPQPRGLQWGLGAVGNAEWTGVPLSAILEEAKVKPGAVEAVLVGADKGAIAADPATPGVIPYERSLPLAKAKRPEVLLAFEMNGKPLTPSHGAPVRAVVGGWFGMASVKWLTKIIVTEKPHGGYWQTMDYSIYERREGDLPNTVAITAMQPKASIARPTFHEVVAAGQPYKVHGAAWAGESKVAKVEVSADGGKTWEAAKLTGEDKAYCWRTWEFAWTPAATGTAKLMAKATTADGATQPEKRDIDRRTYLINHLVATEVLVR